MLGREVDIMLYNKKYQPYNVHSINSHVVIKKSIKFVEIYANALVFCCGKCQTQNVQGHPVGTLT